MNFLKSARVSYFLLGIVTCLISLSLKAEGDDLTENDFPGYSHLNAVRANPKLAEQWFLLRPDEMARVGGEQGLSQMLRNQKFSELASRIDPKWMFWEINTSCALGHAPAWLYGMPADLDLNETLKHNRPLREAVQGLMNSRFASTSVSSAQKSILELTLAQEFIIASQYKVRPLFESTPIALKRNKIGEVNQLISDRALRNTLQLGAAFLINGYPFLLSCAQKPSETSALLTKLLPTSERAQERFFNQIGEDIRKQLAHSGDGFPKERAYQPEPFLEAIDKILTRDMGEEHKMDLIEELNRGTNPTAVAEVVDKLVPAQMRSDSSFRSVLEVLAKSRKLKELVEAADVFFSKEMTCDDRYTVLHWLKDCENLEKAVEDAPKLLSNDMDTQKRLQFIEDLVVGGWSVEEIQAVDKLIPAAMRSADIGRSPLFRGAVGKAIGTIIGHSNPTGLSRAALVFLSQDMSCAERASVILRLDQSENDLETIAQDAEKLISEDMDAQTRLQFFRELIEYGWSVEVIQAVEKLTPGGMRTYYNFEKVVGILRSSLNPIALADAALILIPDDTNHSARASVVSSLNGVNNVQDVVQAAARLIPADMRSYSIFKEVLEILDKSSTKPSDLVDGTLMLIADTGISCYIVRHILKLLVVSDKPAETSAAALQLIPEHMRSDHQFDKVVAILAKSSEPSVLAGLAAGLIQEGKEDVDIYDRASLLLALSQSKNTKEVAQVAIQLMSGEQVSVYNRIQILKFLAGSEKPQEIIEAAKEFLNVFPSVSCSSCLHFIEDLFKSEKPCALLKATKVFMSSQDETHSPSDGSEGRDPDLKEFQDLIQAARKLESFSTSDDSIKLESFLALSRSKDPMSLATKAEKFILECGIYRNQGADIIRELVHSQNPLETIKIAELFLSKEADWPGYRLRLLRFLNKSSRPRELGETVHKMVTPEMTSDDVERVFTDLLAFEDFVAVMQALERIDERGELKNFYPKIINELAKSKKPLEIIANAKSQISTDATPDQIGEVISELVKSETSED